MYPARRAKGAAEAVGGPEDCHGVPAGTYVTVHVARVPTAAAAAAVARVAASLQVRAPVEELFAPFYQLATEEG